MSFKSLIFFGLLAVTLGFTLPEQNTANLESEWVYGDVVPVADDVVLVRKSRSPQGSVSGNVEHSDSMGSSASIDYKHQLNDNLAVNAGAARNFKFNDNSAYAGLSSGPVSGTFKHSDSMGSSAMVDYNRQINKNLDVFAGASRNFRFNENSAHAGLRYRF